MPTPLNNHQLTRIIHDLEEQVARLNAELEEQRKHHEKQLSTHLTMIGDLKTKLLKQAESNHFFHQETTSQLTDLRHRFEAAEAATQHLAQHIILMDLACRPSTPN